MLFLWRVHNKKFHATPAGENWWKLMSCSSRYQWMYPTRRFFSRKICSSKICFPKLILSLSSISCAQLKFCKATPKKNLWLFHFDDKFFDFCLFACVISDFQIVFYLKIFHILYRRLYILLEWSASNNTPSVLIPYDIF